MMSRSPLVLRDNHNYFTYRAAQFTKFLSEFVIYGDVVGEIFLDTRKPSRPEKKSDIITRTGSESVILSGKIVAP